MNASSTAQAGKAKLPIHLPISHQQLGAGTGRAYVVDAVGRKLTAAMPTGFARYRATKFNAEVEAGKSARFIAAKAAAPAPVVVQAAEAPVAGWEPIGTIRTSTSPYMVSADLPMGTSAAAFDAGWLDLMDRLGSAVERHQVVMQQDMDLRADDVMQLPKGYLIGTAEQDDCPVVAVVIDPYKYGAHQLRADAGRIRDAVRFALSGGNATPITHPGA
ncbi:hypothetical protein GCM10007242_16800 [Pigmentiphaga litoralis]|uniref:hypothetical protein n=1 Tax=Pigmentiphaga litoralis TaxID=516702 RepID=UPI001674F4A0|nr:hypothetical protein [Pigmentiphaga litoralis]GGX11334.1 hypothetical protein GCM10007242_16800 [Pigmentiphaga litoralis]